MFSLQEVQRIKELGKNGFGKIDGIFIEIFYEMLRLTLVGFTLKWGWYVEW